VDHDLTAERTLLERQIAALESSIEAANAELAVARDKGVRERGLAAGFVIGVLVVITLAYALLMALMSSIGRID
jgi:hypothetical protein